MSSLDHLSYSSISSYLLCGEAWRRRYVVKEQAPVSDNLVLGSAFHDAAQSYIKGAPDLEAAFEQGWSKQLERGQTIAWEDGVPEPTHDTGLRMVKAKPVRELLAEIRANFDPEHGIIERRVELHVPGVPIPIIGYIDVITKDGVPGDFKTASRMWSDEKAGNQMQTLFYLAALNQEGIDDHQWRFVHYVFSKGQHPSAKTFVSQRKPSEVFGLFEIIKRVWDAIEKHVYLMQTDSWKCSSRYCGYWTTCQARYT